MRKHYPLLMALVAVLCSFNVNAQSNHVVISQVYGGGGNSGATYKNDFIELFNPTTATVDVSGWSIQYASATGNSWSVTTLSGSIEPGHYYLIQQAKGSGGTVDLPTPDAFGNIAMSGTSGKVALVGSATALTGTCPTDGTLVDMVGFGSANCYEGSSPVATLSNTTAGIRNSEGCADTDDNRADFTVGAPNPRNSASAQHLCSGPVLPTISVTRGNDASEPTTNGSFVITLSAPAPAAGVTVTYTFDGSATEGTDYADALQGSVVISGGVTTATVSVTTLDDQVAEGTETIGITIGYAGAAYSIASGTATIALNDNDNAAADRVVINQVYGGGGNTGATYKNDFIELYNNENFAVSLDGWSVQYSSAAGNTWRTTALSGTIPAHGFYLVQEAQGTSGGTLNLPAPDATGSLAMGAASGKVLLSNSTEAQAGENPSGGNVIDIVGYGSSATAYETAPTGGLSNTTAARRVVDGADHDNNATDFEVTEPLPRNSSYTTAAPVVRSFFPPTGRMDIPVNVIPKISFDKPVVKGSGSIMIYENGMLVSTLNVNSDAVLLENSATVSFPMQLSGNKAYYILVDAGTFKDVYGNSFAGIIDTHTWSFSTYDNSVPVTLPASFDFQNCTGAGLLPNGFTQFSTAGAAVWDCTPFGRDPAAPGGTAPFPNAVQINGHNGEVNVPNIDWLISPAVDLTGTQYPLLSFWSRTAFNGLPLQLKVSTDYTGGDPAAANWTDLNGRFPQQASNVWTLSDNINLSAYKGANVHFAFVYISSDEEGARWTVDDIQIINSATPPPPSLTLGTTDIQYRYTAEGAFADKTFAFTGNDLTGDVKLSVIGDFLLSKDGSNYNRAIDYTQEEANNNTETVYVRFAPSAARQSFDGKVTIITSGLKDSVQLKGTSVDPATTLEVVNWNMEWFGSTDPSLGPTNDDLQQQNAEAVLKAADADIYGLVEVVDETRLASIVSHMPGYSYVIGNYGSHVNPPEPNGQPVSEAQKEAFVYKTSIFSNITARPLINNLDVSSASYNNWSSGRYPYLFTADLTLNCVTQKVNFVLIHAKANTSPTTTSYNRRQAAAKELHDTLTTYFAGENVVILGDFNDDLDVSITEGKTVSSYAVFTDDTEQFFSPTLALSLAGKKSTASYNDVIDHVMLSNEMAAYYMPSSATILTDVASDISKYSSTTSDHYPVYTRYEIRNTTAPVVAECPAAQTFCSTTEAVYSVPVFSATDDCGDALTYSYEVTGATERSGSSNDASGAFNIGTSTIKWTATDTWGNMANCTTVVVVNETPVARITNAYVLPSGVDVNTVYTGYAPASVLTLVAVASKGDVNYHYSWTAGADLKLVAGSTDATVQVYATKAGNYASQVSVTVTDGKGCSHTATLSVQVVDVSSGRNHDKVNVCHSGTVLSIEASSVPDHLAHGDRLGSCTSVIPAQTHEAVLKPQVSRLLATAMPNPSVTDFTIKVNGTSGALRIRVTDMLGRVVEQKEHVQPLQTLQLGSNYRPGVYYVEITDGAERTVLKLVKQAQ